MNTEYFSVVESGKKNSMILELQNEKKKKKAYVNGHLNV